MSEASVKEHRREIRRAYGDQALAVIDSHANSISDLINAHTHEVKMRVEHIELARAEAKDASDGLRKLYTHVDGKIDRFIDRGLWSRLAWIIRGR